MDAKTRAPQALIFSSKVNNTPVINADGERIGHIEDVAIDKHTGQVAYAVLSFGGFLGLGEKYHPLLLLTYDPQRRAFVVALDKDQLKAAPSYSMDELADVGDTDERFREPVYTYYANFGMPAYW